MPYKLKHGDVLFISIVREGANKRQVIFKAAGDAAFAAAQKAGQAFSVELRVRKADDERQVIYGIAYPIGTEKDTDTQGDFTDAQGVEEMAYGFMAKGRTAWGVDRDHEYRPLDAAFVAESWLVRKGDPLFANPEDEGAWAVGIKIVDKALYDELKKTGYRGLSIAGTAEREEVKKVGAPLAAPPHNKTAGETTDGWWTKFRRLLGKEKAMDEELKKALGEIAASVKSLTEQVEGLAKGSAPEGGDDEPADLAKQVAELNESLAVLTKAQSTEKQAAALQARQAELAKANEVTAQIVALRKRIDELAETDDAAAELVALDAQLAALTKDDTSTSLSAGGGGEDDPNKALAKQVEDLTKQVAQLSKVSLGSKQQDPAEVAKGKTASIGGLL